MERTGSDPWSGVSQALGPAPPGLGPAPFVGAAGAAGQNCIISRGETNPWSCAQAAASSTNWDCSMGLDGPAYWGQGLGREQSADSTISWGGPAGSDCTTSWVSGLHTDCTTSSKGYQTSDLTTSSEPSQPSDGVTLACYPKNNHRGERSAGPESSEAEPRRVGAGPGKLAAKVRGCHLRARERR